MVDETIEEAFLTNRSISYTVKGLQYEAESACRKMVEDQQIKDYQVSLDAENNCTHITLDGVNVEVELIAKDEL